MSETKKNLGIIGGMGSHAGAWLLQRILSLSEAATDQDYLEIFLHNNSKIPDRTKAIIYNETSPLPELKRTIAYFNDLNVAVAVMACMTAHYYYADLRTLFRGELLDVCGVVVEEILHNEEYNGKKKIGLIGSTGMLKSGIFQRRLEPLGYEVLVLNDSDQQQYLMEPLYGINGIKAGNTADSIKRLFYRQFDILHDQGAELIIGACSEVPLIVRERVDFPFIDSFDLLAVKTVEYCYNRTFQGIHI